MSVPTQDNVLGAVVFFSYIVAALLLTGILCIDVQKAFSNRVLSTVQRQQRQTPRQVKEAGPDRKASTSLLAALATLSFAVLSYHMLNFLILSYQSWSSSAPILPATLPATPQVTWHAFHSALGNLSSGNIWTWAVESTLFRDFAEVICNDSHRFWWTQAALVYSYTWNVYMSIEGTSLRTPCLLWCTAAEACRLRGSEEGSTSLGIFSAGSDSARVLCPEYVSIVNGAPL